MISKIFNSRLFKSSIIYTASSALNSMIPFLMMPILTRYINPTDYGHLAMFNVIVSILIPFIGLSLHGAMYKKYYELKSDHFKIYVFNILLILIVSFAIVIASLTLFSDFIVSFTEFTLTINNWAYTVSIVALLTFINQLLLTIWQLQHKALKYGIFQIAKTIVYTILVLLFIIYYNYSWEWIIMASFVSLLIFSIISMVLMIKENMIQVSLNLAYIKNALNFGIPMLPTALKDTIMSTTDRLFLVNIASLSAVGLYSIAFQLSMVLILLTSSFNSAFSPWLFEKLKLNEKLTLLTIVRYTYLYFILIIFFGIVWILIANLIVNYLLDSQYKNSVEYITWIVFSFVFGGMHSMVVNYIYYSQKTIVYGIISIIIIVSNIVLNYILIKINGAVGVAQATCIASFLMFVLTWILSSKVHPMPWFSFWRKNEA